jgi:hypothetical protein
MLTADQQKSISSHVPYFRKYLRSEEGMKDLENRRRKSQYFQKLKQRETPQIDENEIERIVSILWATAMWGNKQRYVERLINENGVAKVRTELGHLLSADEPVAKRYGRCVANLKYLGCAAVTEILCYAEPDKCCMWNDRTRRALQILGFENLLPVRKQQLTEEELDSFNAVALEIADLLREKGCSDVDLIIVDFFLYEVWRRVSMKGPDVNKPILSHNEIRNEIAQIGSWLGFQTSTEKWIAPGAQVDVVWTAAIGNLGVVNYVFEVQVKGSIDGLIMNLMKAVGNPTVQKVIAVSDGAQLEEIRKNVQNLPESFREKLSCWDFQDVTAVYEALQQVQDSISKLALVVDSFQVGK